MNTLSAVLAAVLTLAAPGAIDGPRPIAEGWDYAPAMKRVAGRPGARPGVVLHVGDSITYANPYGQWARAGAGRTPDDLKALAWMHAGAEDDSDGWWLARFDHPDGGRSHTACGGLRADELLAGGKQNLPPLRDLIARYRPQVVVLMIGTNDASAGRAVAAYRKDMAEIVDTILDGGAIGLLSTIPPHPGRPDLAKSYNEALRALARERGLPLIDFEREILERRPDDWNGTLLGQDDVHPTADRAGASPASAPTAENLRNSGYLLRGWLSVRKVAEVKRRVLDDLPKSTASEPLRVPVTRDTWLSDVGREADGSNGGAANLKLKSHQEMSIIDFDPAPLRGRSIRRATLHLRSTGGPTLRRVTVGGVGADWVEGTAANYEPQPGSSTFRHRRHPDLPWSADGGDLCNVILGQGGTNWRMADASPPDEHGWQAVPVDPAVLSARAAGLSYGLLLFDDTGSEWTRDGEKFTVHLFPNRFVRSKDSGRDNAPYLTVEPGPEDRAAPAAPSGLRAEPGDLPAGETWLSWTTPKDEGPAGTIGFFVRVDGRDAPRAIIPLAGPPGEPVRMHLRDLALKPGASAKVEVRAADAAGNVGPPASASIRVSALVAKPLPDTGPAPFEGNGPLPKLGAAEVAVIDELDKVHPDDGSMIPPQTAGYLAANHLWDAKARRIRLHAARNESVALQVLLKGGEGDIRPSITFDDGKKIETQFSDYINVSSQKGPLPDPVAPLKPGASLGKSGHPNRALHVELYVPHDLQPGEHRGTLTLKSGGESLALGVSLTVWDFTLPDYLSFLPEMNCYGLPANERDFYRLAHRHRTYLNRVPYFHNGGIADGCAPTWDGKRLDWSAWDKRFGPLLDGSAFADLPRKGVPLDAFYLPIFENWPTPMEGNYNGDYWADRAFPASYRAAFVEVSRQFAEHFNQHKWDDTLFEFYLNGKNNFKERGWSRGTCPWLLDEPASFQDFWALRYFGSAFHDGVNKAPGKAKLAFRADISRPQWQRDALDGLLDVNVVGGAMRPYRRMVMDRKRANGEVAIEYGGANPIEEPNTQAVGWSLDAWSLGADGVLPWQTIGNAESWSKADPLSLFYPRGDREPPVPSIRLKAYRRGQQDVEYLTLLALLRHEPREAIGARVREALRLEGTRRGSGFQGGEDAGRIDYARLRPQDLWSLRVRVGRALSDAHPAPKRRLVDFRPPRRDPSHLRPAYFSTADGGR